jgi:hypothetical protein
MVPKIFQTGAAIYTAVVVAQTTGPKGSNCEFWVYRDVFMATAWKRAKTSSPDFGENGPGCFTMTTPRLTLPSSPSNFWQNIKWLSSPAHCTPLIWHPVSSSCLQKWNWNWKDAGSILFEGIQVESQNMLDTDRKGLPGSVTATEETVGPVCTCGMELLRGWWRLMGLMVSFLIFTASVRNILGTSSYITCNKILLFAFFFFLYLCASQICVHFVVAVLYIFLDSKNKLDIQYYNKQTGKKKSFFFCILGKYYTFVY